MSKEERHYPQTRWTLEELLPETRGPAVEQTLESMEATTKAIEAFRPSLSRDMSVEDFSRAMGLIEEFSKISSRLLSYGQLRFSEDTLNQEALSFMGRAEQAVTEAHNRILFFDLWWKALDDEAAARFLPFAGDASYYLEQERLFKPHTLVESEERIINLKDVNGANALLTLYDMITNKFVFELTVEGEKKKLTREGLTVYMRSPSADVREAAYKEQFRIYEGESAVLSQIYFHRVRDWASENLALRHFASPITVRNMANDVSDAVVDTLLDVCAEESGVFQRYFRLKRQWLGLPSERLRRYDLYAPISKSTPRMVSYGDAVEMVLECFEGFSPTMARLARRIFDEGHIDAEIRSNKRGGAFCHSVVPGLSPWVLANYTGEIRQVATLAHELGHAVHSLAAGGHSVLTFQSTLPLAETASVFSEMLLLEHLLKEEKEHDVRRDLVAEAVDSAYATVMRQAFFVLFEREAHRAVLEGKTTQELNQLYLANLTRQFGDAIEISHDFQREWITIPHFYHAPFYCYAYSFGQLLSLSLYRHYKEEGKGFSEKLVKILSYGGSARPQDILHESGIDITNAEFWRGGFRVIEKMIGELKELAVSQGPDKGK